MSPLIKTSSTAKTRTQRPRNMRDKLGLCQWFHFKDYAAVERTVQLLGDLGVRHLRTGISWADFLRPGGKAWYDWQMTMLGEFNVLLSVWHTPPSISQGNCCNSPPERLRDYADFIDVIITEYERWFDALELWNEPNNRYKWNFEKYDPSWHQFAEMIGAAAHWAKHRGQTTVLGGMIPVDHHWLKLMERHGVLKYIDVIAIHGFPGMWWPNHPNWEWHEHWQGWKAKLDYLKPHTGKRPIWITETGLATWDLATQRAAKHDLQAQMLADAASSACPRIYWYSAIDLDPDREAIEGFHVDENEYHMGLLNADGKPKPALATFAQLIAS